MTDFIFKQLINGEWVEASNGGTWDLINPATEEIIQSIPYGTATDAETALKAADTAFKQWSRTTPYYRAEILLKAAEWIQTHAETCAKITTEESGKPLSESQAEWKSAPNYLIWAAEEAKRTYGRTIPARLTTRRIQTIQQPIGVVGTITAWNFPIYNVVRAWSSALAAGCTVVGRPSEFTPRSAMILAYALNNIAGAPPGVINLINGDPESMGQAMLSAPHCRKISFTGSTQVGKRLLEGASKTITRLGLELGGNAPLLIFPDVKDVKKLAQLSVAWKLRNCGQVCVAPQRFLVHTSIAEEFIDYATQFANQQVIGNGLDSKTTVGPLINTKQRDRIERLVRDTVSLGGEVMCGGFRPADFEKGYFYQPTVMTNIQPSMPVFEEEIFGPIMPIILFTEPEEALTLANQSAYGLAAFVQTNDLNTALLMSEKLDYGMVCINDWLPATPEAPMGGIKQSGLGHESGLEGVADYMETKVVFIGGVV